MEAKFKELQFVEVDGTATGYGNLIGWISEINLDKIIGKPFYTVRVYSTYTDSVYVEERLLTPAEEPKK